jgi:hypothetical protein
MDIRAVKLSALSGKGNQRCPQLGADYCFIGTGPAGQKNEIKTRNGPCDFSKTSRLDRDIFVPSAMLIWCGL